MARITKTGHYDAPIERVFALATDFERYPQWNVNYSEIKQVTKPLAIGTKVSGVMQFMGRRLEGTGEVVEVDPPRLFRVVGARLEGGRTDTTYRFTAVETGTDFVIDIEYELPTGIIGHIADRLFVERAVERDLQHSIENFTALVKAEVPQLVTA